MRILLFVFACIVTLARGAAPSAPDTASQNVSPGSSQIVMNNQAFVLVAKDEGKSVKTYRYVTAGSTAEEWTEMVTHQVLTLANRSGADEVLAYLKDQNSASIRMEGILETRRASVFASLAPKTDQTESQLGVGLIFIDLVNPLEVHLISYTLKPNRMSAADTEEKLRSWRDLFRARATALAASM